MGSAATNTDAAALIARVAERHDWTPGELAAALRVTPKAVSSWARLGLPEARGRELEKLLAAPPTRVDVRSVRVRLRLTQGQLAERLGTTKRSVGRWETGSQRVPAPIREALAEMAEGAPNPVRTARDRLGATQLEIARRLGVSGSLVSRWERRSELPPEYERTLAALEPDGSIAPSGEWIQERRLERGLSLRQLAERLEREPARVSEWEQGDAVPPPGVRSALRRELGGGKAGTASRDDDVLEVVRARPGLSRPQLLERFPPHDAGAVAGALQRHVWAGRLFRARGVVLDRVGRPRFVWRYYPRPQADEAVSATVTGDWLRAQLERKGWSQDGFARALGVSREAVRYWVRRGPRPLPAGRQADVVRVLVSERPPAREAEASALPDLRELRRSAGLTQPALADRLGVHQSQVSGWERGAVRITEGRAEQILAVLGAARAERVTGAELRAARVRTGWSQGELATRLGVKRARLRRWEWGRSPIPAELWPAIRAELEAAPAAVRGEPMEDLRERRAEIRWSQRELAQRLGVWQADVSRWEHGAAVPPELRERLERELEAGVPAADPGAERRAAIVALVAEEPGLSPRAVWQRVGGQWSAVRAVIAALAEAGELHRRPAGYVDRAGRRRFRRGLYLGSAAAPAAALAGTEIVGRREVLGWSQAELARRLGISQTIVNRWEHSKVAPAPEQAAELERVFATGAEELDPSARARLERLEVLLAATRGRLGLSVSEMARRLGVDRGTYAAWELGQRPVSSWRRREVLVALDQLEAAGAATAA